MAAPRKFPDEVRERAVRLVFDVEEEAGSISGACRRHQRQVAVAVKRAREVALLPYAVN